MLTLTTANLEFINIPDSSPSFVSLLSANERLPVPLRPQRAFLARAAPVPDGFRFYLVLERDRTLLRSIAPHEAAVVLPDAYDYLTDGDI